MVTDEIIIQAMKADIQNGFRILMKKYEHPIYWHIRRMVMTYDDSKDVMQETFIRVFKSFGQYNEQHTLKTWIYTIATNEALRFLGKRQGKIMMSLDDVESETVNLEAETYLDQGDALTIKLQKAIHTLPEKQQLAFNMRYYDKLSYDEIAEITGLSATSMKANYHLAKEKIIKYMNQ